MDQAAQSQRNGKPFIPMPVQIVERERARNNDVVNVHCKTGSETVIARYPRSASTRPPCDQLDILAAQFLSTRLARLAAIEQIRSGANFGNSIYTVLRRFSGK